MLSVFLSILANLKETQHIICVSIGMGMCYDAVNHCIWTVSQDWVDQYLSPAHQSTHHVLSRLGISKDPCAAIATVTGWFYLLELDPLCLVMHTLGILMVSYIVCK